MSNETIIPFWLEVKKTYIADNFDQLLRYLSEYALHPEDTSIMNNVSSDFGRTFQALQELAYDYLYALENDCLYTHEETTWTDVSFKVRVMLTYLLTAKIKGKTDFRVLAQVADLLLLLRNATSLSTLASLQKVIKACMTESNVDTYGFTWNHLQEWSVTPEVLCTHLANTSFDSPDDAMFCTEGKGFLTIKDNIIHIAPMNRGQYYKQKLAKQCATLSGIELDVAEKDRERKIETFNDLQSIFNILHNAQQNLKPTLVKAKKIYAVGDILVVKVTGFYEYGLTVETIDPSYEVISGKVYIGVAFNLDHNDFKQYFKEDDLIMVACQDNDNYPFCISKAFESFYEPYIDQCSSATYGIYHSTFTGGYQWRTIDGLLVNVFEKNPSESIREAIENRTPVALDIQESKRDNKNNLVINAFYSDDAVSDDVPSGNEFVAAAKESILEAFAEYAQNHAPTTTDEPNYKDIDEHYVRILSHLEYLYAQKVPHTRDRYTHLCIARFIATIVQDTLDTDYITMDMAFQAALVQFATGYSPNLLNFTPKEELAGLKSVRWRQDIITSLSSYKETGSSLNLLEFCNLSPEETHEAINGLIASSNTLIGKINEPEINRIKKQIARHLRVDDEFISTIPNVTYYGEESDTLEFKSSAVFPPENKGQAEPTKQMWTILKTICGFMNTLSGGEILLGVNDNGHSCGLTNDINYLHQNKTITEASMDKYRNYIRDYAAKVFVDDNGIATSKDITTERINYIIEKDKEGNDILRIQVRPYEYGIVRCYNDRPDYISRSYIRTSGATLTMTDEMEKQTRDRKMKAAYDDKRHLFIVLQQAAKEKKQVELIGYTSKTEKRNRIVEPYKALPEHDAFLCYDTTVSKSPHREFKISRIEDVRVLNKSWLYERRHKNLTVDVFSMMEDPGSKPYTVELKLANKACTLLKEEYKKAADLISENPDTADNDEYPWIFKASICKNEGIGRFYIGLAPFIKIVKGDKLKAYVRDYRDKHLNDDTLNS